MSHRCSSERSNITKRSRENCVQSCKLTRGIIDRESSSKIPTGDKSFSAESRRNFSGRVGGELFALVLKLSLSKVGCSPPYYGQAVASPV